MVVAIFFFQKFEGQGQRSKVNSIKLTVHVYSGHFSNTDDALPFI